MSQAASNSSSPRVKPLRVALVAGEDSLALLGPAVRHLVVGLLDEPMHVTLVAPERADTSYLPDPPVEILRHGSLRVPLRRTRALDDLARRVTDSGAGLLHALDADALKLTRQLAERCDLDYVVSVLGLDSGVHVSDRHCRAVLAGSEPIRSQLVESRSAPPDLVGVLPPAVHRARKATCFIDPRHAPSIVAAGPLTESKHFETVMQAFVQLLRGRPECVFFIVGSGRAESHLRRRASEMGVMTHLTFVQPQDTDLLASIVEAADIFISPTPSHRIEVDLLVAMAAGDPVVVAGADACDFVVNGQTALTYAVADAQDLAGRLDSLLDDRAWARSLARNALDHLARHHSPARMAACLADLYHTITGRKRT